MKVKKNDTVKVISGKDRGTISKIDAVYPDTEMVRVENVNMVKRHMKKSGKAEAGIISISKPIAVSRVMVVCPKCQKAIRVKYVLDNGKKYRVCRKCEALLDTKK